MPEVAYLHRNERSGCANHQPFGPAFLKVNAKPLGEEDRTVKKREQRCRAERPAAREHVLQFGEKKMNRLAMVKQNLIVRPIRNLFEPDIGRASCRERV